MPIFSLCSNVGANTGPIACDKRRGIPENLLVGGKAFTPVEYASQAAFQAAMIAAINLPNGDSDKIYPFPIIQNVTDNTEENTVGTTGKGFRMILKEGKPAYAFGVLVGSTLEKNLRKFNNQIVPVFVLDNARDVDGMLDGSNNFVGQQALIFVDGKPYSNGNDVDSEYTNVEVSFLSATDFFDNYAFIKTTFTSAALEGLVDAGLYEAAAPTSNVYQIGAKALTPELGSMYSFFDKYQDELADDALWIAETGTDFGTTLAITAVAKNVTLKSWAVTFDSTAHTALPSDAEIRVRWVGPADLLAAGVRGLESVPVIVVKP